MKMPPIWRMALPWVMFVSYLLFSGVKSSENNTVFSYYHGTSKFNHLAVDQNQGAVFIGAVNHLYILSSDLIPLGNITTPQKRIGENYNKILVVNSRDSQLIACGSTDEFVCELYNFGSDTLHHALTFSGKSDGMVENGANSSTVAFISKFNQDEKSRILKLYFAVSHGNYSTTLPATNIRTLNFDRNLRTYAEVSIFHLRLLNIPYREASLVNYVHGFESGKYAYFLTTQKKSSEQSTYISKVIRICYDDKSQQHGYIEIPIECRGGKSLYNLIQAANVGNPNELLARSLKISPDDDVLFATFSKSQTIEDTSNKSSDHSALCIYSVKAINEKFDENGCSCFNGSECREFKAKSPHKRCSNYSEMVGSNLCSLTTNMSLEGIIPIIEYPVVTFDALSTAITIKSTATHNDVFIGTNIGHLKKIVVNNATNVCELADILIDEGSPVNSDLLFSPQNDSLYIMTDRKLAKINLPIHPIDCSIHTDYRTCVHQNTPKLCGWCGLTNKCTTRCDCSYGEYYAWLQSYLNEEVVITLNSTVVFKNDTVKSLLWGRSRLPAIWQSFTCEFTIENKSLYYSGKGLFRENENNFYNLQCPLPEPHDVPQIPVGTIHLNGTLSISTPQISNIVKMNIKLFDCNECISCGEYNSSILDCGWCPMEGKCESLIPKIIEFFPKQGPAYGGTVLTIKGEHFNIDKLIIVSIGNASCLVFSFTLQEIKCITSSSTEKKTKIVVKYDERILPFRNNTFTYIKDEHHNEKGFNIEPKGILDGGVTILVLICSNITHKSLRGISFHVFDGIRMYNSSCNYIQKDSAVACPSPQIPRMNNLELDAEHPKSMEFSLTDATGKNITIAKKQLFLLYPNPKFHHFVNSSVQFDGSKFVIIHGVDIDNACQVTDILVKVGSFYCDVRSISSKEVVCRLPKNSSAEVEYVNVLIGKHFNTTVPKQHANLNPNSNPNTDPDPDPNLNSDLNPNPNPNPNPDLSPNPDPDSNPNPNPNLNHYSNHKNGPISIFIPGTAIFGMIVISLLIGYHFLYRRKSLTTMQQQSNGMGMETITAGKCIKRVVIENQINLDEKSLNTQALPNVAIENASKSSLNNSTTTLSQTHYLLPVDDKWEFPRSKLILGKCIEEGEFGKVLLGEALGILPEYPTMTVAVKMLKDTSTDSDMMDLVSEMEIMKSVGTHDNVLRLLGCCTQDGSLLIITEFASHGNLHNFLQRQIPSGDNAQPLSDLSVKDLMNFALQVAEGMDYLAARKCAHRDLAARNILVSEDHTMKISNFGLPGDIQNKDNKRKSDGRLSIKWMAPEAFCHSIFSTQSDVWSYGILLWEIFTLGCEPYPSVMDMGKLYQALHSGYRMEKPPHCSEEMYNLMRKCWSFIPDGRPLFSEISEDLEELLSNDELLERCHLHWPDIQEFNNAMILFWHNN